MPVDKFEAALAAVNWKGNIATLLADKAAADELVSTNLRLAIWARQLESADQGAAALAFVREMQMAGQHAAVLIALALYKPAASAMRAMLETALYYSFFRTHPTELATLSRRTGYYVEKREVLEFHKEHTAKFPDLQQKLGVISRLERWYAAVSSLVHGHEPGAWIEHRSVAEIKPIKSTQNLAIATFKEGEEIVHRFFLCTVGRELWDGFSTEAKKRLLSGLPGTEKQALGLDAA